MGPLVSALRTAALGDAQEADPVDELLRKVIARVRNEIAAGGHVVSADPLKVPASLVGLVARWVVWDAKGRLELDVTEQERTDHRDDIAYLRRIAEGKMGVELPDDAITPEVTSGAQVQVVQSRERQATRERLSGLL